MQLKQIIKSLGQKVWNWIDLKFVSLLIAYFLMFSQFLGLLMILFLFAVDEKAVRMLDHNDRNFSANLVILVVAASFILIVAFLMVTCSVVLIIGLHKNRQYIKAYLLCSTFTLVMSIFFNILYEFTFVKDPTATLPRALSVLMNALYIFVIKTYWERINPNNATAQVETA
ncbi:unnamed protein product, partial [Iphiclides podalirius]